MLVLFTMISQSTKRLKSIFVIRIFFFFFMKKKIFDFIWVHLFFEFYPTTVLKVYFSCRTTIGNLQVFPLYAKLTVIVLLNNK